MTIRKLPTGVTVGLQEGATNVAGKDRIGEGIGGHWWTTVAASVGNVKTLVVAVVVGHFGGGMDFGGEDRKR